MSLAKWIPIGSGLVLGLALAGCAGTGAQKSEEPDRGGCRASRRSECARPRGGSWRCGVSSTVRRRAPMSAPRSWRTTSRSRSRRHSHRVRASPVDARARCRRPLARAESHERGGASFAAVRRTPSCIKSIVPPSTSRSCSIPRSSIPKPAISRCCRSSRTRARRRPSPPFCRSSLSGTPILPNPTTRSLARRCSPRTSRLPPSMRSARPISRRSGRARPCSSARCRWSKAITMLAWRPRAARSSKIRGTTTASNMRSC